MAVAIMALRTLVQRVRIRRGRLLICISEHFRDHLVHDYGFPLERTVVVPNPVRLERFSSHERPVGNIAARARAGPRRRAQGHRGRGRHRETAARARRRARACGSSADRGSGRTTRGCSRSCRARTPPTWVGSGPWTYRPSWQRPTCCCRRAATSRSALTVGEALAAGVPVVATSEVGAIEGVAESVVAEVAPGDAAGMAAAICELHARLRDNQAELRATARTEAERLFAPDVVCAQISAALERLVRGDGRSSEEERPRLKSGASASEAGDRPTHAE